MPPPKRQSLLFASLGIALKTLLSLLVYAMPLLGFWVASSLAAYRGGAAWLPVVVGLLAFPVAPLAWDAVSELRRQKRGDTRKRILTFGDRILLRTFAITFTLIVLLLAARPELAFVALSTRGDWMLDGRHGAGAEKTRRVLFGAAQGLEWLYLIAHESLCRSGRGRRKARSAETERKRQPGSRHRRRAGHSAGPAPHSVGRAGR
jgi:hypothetical protein